MVVTEIPGGFLAGRESDYNADQRTKGEGGPFEHVLREEEPARTPNENPLPLLPYHRFSLSFLANLCSEKYIVSVRRAPHYATAVNITEVAA